MSLRFSWLEFSKSLQFCLQFYHVRSQLTFTQQKWEKLVVAINKYPEKLTFVYFAYPGLCNFKLACDNMKERLPSKRPWNTIASSFFYKFLYIYRLEIDMSSMRSRFAYLGKLRNNSTFFDFSEKCENLKKLKRFLNLTFSRLEQIWKKKLKKIDATP